ncbi:MAG TPA: hypothetical protein VH682_13540 [Gemmataceae bacterium]
MRMSVLFSSAVLMTVVVCLPAQETKPPRTVTRFDDGVAHLVFSLDGKTLAAACSSSTHTTGMVQLWDVAARKQRTILKGRNGPPCSLAFLADGKTLAVGNHDGTVTLWDLSTSEERATFDLHGKAVHSIAATPDGKALACGAEGAITLLDLSTGKERFAIHSFKGYSDLDFWPRGAVALSPDGASLLLAGVDESLRLRDVVTGKEKARLWIPGGGGKRQPSAGATLAFSPDGRTIACGTVSAVRLWEVASGKERCVLEGHTNIISGVAFTPDGRTLVTGSYDCTVKLWDVSKGTELAKLDRHTGTPAVVAVSPDGKTVASAGRRKEIRFLDIERWTKSKADDGKLSEEDLQKAWEALGGDDAPAAYRAFGSLVRAPRQAISFLQQRLSPVPALPKRVTQLVADLDSDKFAARERATRELERLGKVAEPTLRKALEGSPSAELRRRAEHLLGRLDGAELSRARLQKLRAVEVLEFISTPETLKVLEELAKGAPEARLTREARASVRRLGRR